MWHEVVNSSISDVADGQYSKVPAGWLFSRFAKLNTAACLSINISVVLYVQGFCLFIVSAIMQAFLVVGPHFFDACKQDIVVVLLRHLYCL